MGAIVDAKHRLLGLRALCEAHDLLLHRGRQGQRRVGCEGHPPVVPEHLEVKRQPPKRLAVIAIRGEKACGQACFERDESHDGVHEREVGGAYGLDLEDVERTVDGPHA